MLGLPGYSVAPGIGTSSFQINRASTGSPGLILGQFGSGGTMSDSFALYFEGYIGYARYDPEFLFSEGQQERRLPTRWNSLAGMAGIGWDFHLSEHWVLRPIVNGMVGYVASDANLFGLHLNFKTDTDLRFLSYGHIDSAGAALVLGYYKHQEAYEFDMELRSTSLWLTTWGDTSPAVRGQANAVSASLWTRLRWPTGVEVLNRPLRYVVEATHSNFFADQARALGFNSLTSVGGGLEVDVGGLEVGAFGVTVQRVRLMGRYFFGPDVSGFSAGIGVSF